MKLIELFTVMKFTTDVNVYTEDDEILAYGRLSAIFNAISLSNPPKWLNLDVSLIDYDADDGIVEVRVREGFDD